MLFYLMILVQIPIYLLGTFVNNLWELFGKANYSNYFSLFLDLVTFFSVFFFLYEVYKQDVERTEWLLGDHTNRTFSDEKAAQEKEGARKYSFFACVGLPIFFWLTKKIISLIRIIMQSYDLSAENSTQDLEL